MKSFMQSPPSPAESALREDFIRIKGFTLIEMSIVLVIIGLIIGGILLGQDLIKASETRAQIAQIEKYNSAVNTFHNKYGGIPGDLSVVLANQFGFLVPYGCNGGQGGRDGNGLIDGIGPGFPFYQGEGETALFWADLSSAKLIDGTFNATSVVCDLGGQAVVMNLTPGASYVGNYFPPGKIGYGTFLYVYETGGQNWYGLSSVTSTDTAGNLLSSPLIPVIEAYNIDKKVDDGIPTSGTIVAAYLNDSANAVVHPHGQVNDSATSCYNTTNNTYSISASANQGAGLNCALSFKFQ
jgi:prepilin-type N-terminal cleavage/methylation domain-containing protein